MPNVLYGLRSYIIFIPEQHLEVSISRSMVLSQQQSPAATSRYRISEIPLLYILVNLSDMHFLFIY